MDGMALRDQVRAAEAEIANGRTERALALCQQLQAGYPRAIVVQRLLGEIYLAMNRPDEALRAMARVLASDPDDARACCARAIAHQMQGDRATALTWYRRACEIRPEDNMLRQAYRELATPLGQKPYQMSGAALARLYLRGDLYLHAEHEWQGVLAREPERLDALLGLAESYWRSGDGTRAGNTVRRVLTQAPECVKGLLILAAAEQIAGNEGASRELLGQAADLDPEHRLGRALYAELIGAGNSALESHLFADGGGFASGENETGAFPAIVTGQHGIFSAAPPSGSLPVAAQEDLAAVSSLANSRSGGVPEDFHSIFAETEFMLWGRDDDIVSVPVVEPPVLAPSASPLLGAELPVDDESERMRPAVPRPAFGSPDGSMEDTESRAAVGWVQWLQALGARPLDRARAPIPAVTAQGPAVESPSRGSSSGSLKGIFDSLETPAVRPSAPPIQPPFDLERSETSPATTSPGSQNGMDNPVVRWDLPAEDAGSGVRSWGLDDGNTPFAPPEPDVTAAAGIPGEGDATLIGPLAGSNVVSPAPAGSGWPGSSNDANDVNDANDANERAFVPNDPGDSPTTLEALQDTFTASGFRPYEPRPGDLAALADQPDARPGEALPITARREGFVSRASGPAPWDPPAARGELDALSAADGAPEFGTLIEQARALRARGQLAEALEAYAAELREAPERTDEVIADVRAIAEQSDDASAFRLLGDAYIHAGSYEQALEAYNQAQARAQGESA